jgi:antitoxin component HigA of HigAB toxin-antitoxin module
MIDSEQDYRHALARADALIDIVSARDARDTAEGRELDVLTDLIELYESRHYPMCAK